LFLVSATLLSAQSRAVVLPCASTRESVLLPNCMTWPDLVLTSNQAGPLPAVPWAMDTREALDLGAVLAAVGAIGAGNDDQPLPIHAEAIVGVVIDAAAHAVLRQRLGAVADRGQAVERPAHAEQAVAALAAVGEREGRDHAGRAGRYHDGDAVGRASRCAHAELARQRHSLRSGGCRPSSNKETANPRAVVIAEMQFFVRKIRRPTLLDTDPLPLKRRY
jgi:hypothetical protein